MGLCAFDIYKRMREKIGEVDDAVIHLDRNSDRLSEGLSPPCVVFKELRRSGRQSYRERI